MSVFLPSQSPSNLLSAPKILPFFQNQIVFPLPSPSEALSQLGPSSDTRSAFSPQGLCSFIPPGPLSSVPALTSHPPFSTAPTLARVALGCFLEPGPGKDCRMSLCSMWTLFCLAGWYEGERLRDGERGWFPMECAKEITCQATIDKNVERMGRLLGLETNV